MHPWKRFRVMSIGTSPELTQLPLQQQIIMLKDIFLSIAINGKIKIP